jgi:pimeloyl-ACP methyl ester carboxylesterase
MGDAGRSYQAFRDRQYPLAQEISPRLEGLIGDCFWPGDADWASLLDKTDFFFYPSAVHRAPDAGRLLAEYLSRLPDLLQVHFVGHSLGCRVVLECIRHLKRGPQVGQVILMAAAVPTFMVAEGRNLASAMKKAGSVLVLYSRADEVLHYSFPPGQTLAGKGEGILPVALGRDGPPAGTSGRIESHLVANAGHGDYWGAWEQDDIPSRKSEEAASKVAGLVAGNLRLGQRRREVGTQRAPATETLAGFRRKGVPQRKLE